MITITKITEPTTFNLTGQPIQNRVITFTVDNHGPFTVSIPTNEFTAARAQAELEKVAREIRVLLSAKI